MDGVMIAFEAPDGERRYGTFSVDDYDRQLADGGLDVYLEKIAYPKLRAVWRPDFREVGRQVERGVVPGQPVVYAGDTP